MTPTEALQQLDETGDPDRIGLDWERSAAGDRIPAFLTQQQITESLAFCGFGHEYTAALIDTARIVTRSPALLRLARHAAWALFEGPESRELLGWPAFSRSLGDRAGLFWMLIGLGVVPFARKHHKSLGIPESFTRDTCRQVWLYCEGYKSNYDGVPGIQRIRTNWLRHYVREPIFRIGRLEYWRKPNPIPPHAYRNRRSGLTVALAWPDLKIDLDGIPIPGEPDGGYWHTTFEETEQGATGQPIAPFGKVLHRTITLPSAEWEPVLRPDDDILQVHIPPVDPLNLESVRSSQVEALAFFKQHFPDSSPRAFVSTSWMFSDLLETWFPESNTVQYLSELYIFPLASDSGLSFIFPKGFTPETAARDTRLQRAILDHLAKGKRWRIGGMFLLVDDLKYFGSQHYRSAWKLSEFAESR